MVIAFASAPISVVAIATLLELLVTCLWREATSIHALISASVSFGAFTASVAAFFAAMSVVSALEAF